MLVVHHDPPKTPNQMPIIIFVLLILVRGNDNDSPITRILLHLLWDFCLTDIT